jgi:hypothetical protein
MAATSKSGEIGSKAAQGRVDGMLRECRERTMKEGVCGSAALLRSYQKDITEIGAQEICGGEPATVQEIG